MTERMVAALAAAESARRDLMAAVSPLDDTSLTRRLDSASWTPLEVLEHLRLSEESIVRLLAHRLLRARERGLTPGAPSADAAGDAVTLADVAADSPEILLPQPGLSRDRVLAGLAGTRDALRTLCAEVDAYDGTQVVARHIVLGEIHFYQWIHFVGAHEARHRRQIDRILGGP